MSISLVKCLLVFTVHAVSPAALNPTDSKILLMVKQLQQYAKKQDSVARLIQNHIARQDNLISTLQDRIQRQDERLIQQERLINKLQEQGQKQNEFLNELKRRQDEFVTKQDDIIIMLKEQGQRPDTTNDEDHQPLPLQEQWKNQKEHIIKEESTLTMAINSTSSTDPMSDRMHDLPVNYTKDKKAVLPPKHVGNKVLTPGLAVRAVDGPIAFEAKPSRAINHLGLNQIIVFDQVVLNVGNAYNHQHGIFTAPRSGVYIFSTSLMAGPDKDVEAQMIKNGVFIAGAIAQGIHENDQGSVTVVSQLERGDEVWVENTWPADTAIRGHGYSSFMGCLVVKI